MTGSPISPSPERSSSRQHRGRFTSSIDRGSVPQRADPRGAGSHPVPELVQAATIELQSGVDFISNADLEIALADTELSATDQQAILDANETARIGTLQNGAFMLALLAVFGLFASRGIPTSLSPVEDDEGELVGKDDEPAPD